MSEVALELARKEKNKISNRKYMENHQELIKELARKYRETHKEKTMEYNKRWYIANKDKQSERVQCECGGCCRRDSRTKHFQSKLHHYWLEHGVPKPQLIELEY